MRFKFLQVSLVIFFLVINTAYFWEGFFGLLTIVLWGILIIIYISFSIILLVKLFHAVKDKFKSKNELIDVALLVTILALILIRPYGLINYDRLLGYDILVASAEGGGNCTTTLKLNSRNRFIERSICFGVSDIRGTYKFKNDTIYFKTHGFKTDFRYLARIEEEISVNDNKKDYYLTRYKNLKDTTGYSFYITKINLKKIEELRSLH
jgi:hypothetical protein